MAPEVSPHFAPGRFIDNNNILLWDLLGAGTYGRVYHAIDIISGDHYAAKCFTFIPDPTTGQLSDNDSLQLKRVEYEYTLHKVVADECTRILPVYRILLEQDEGHIYACILSRVCERDLWDLIKTGYFIDHPHRVRRVMTDIARAIEHCHKMNISHRDIKPENILLADRGQSVYLADFGFARESDMSGSWKVGTGTYLAPGMHPSRHLYTT